MDVISKSEEQTLKLGKAFGKRLKSGDIVAFYGGLGAGKTTFIKGVIQGLDIDDRVTSPTFMFMKMYITPQQASVFHIDLYRTESEADVKALGLAELMEQDNVIMLIEWAEKMEQLLPEKTIKVAFTTKREGDRRLTSQSSKLHDLA